jgi:hypothetical protein
MSRLKMQLKYVHAKSHKHYWNALPVQCQLTAMSAPDVLSLHIAICKEALHVPPHRQPPKA